MVRRCWVNFQCRGVLLIWITVGQGPTALAVGACGVVVDIFTLVYHFSFLSPSLWKTARYRLEYCLKGSLSPKQPTIFTYRGGGWVLRWCWVNFQCRGVFLIWLTVGQGPTALAVGAGGGCFDIFTIIYLFSPLSPSLCETARYRLKYCLKGPLDPKQPTS